ncbi:MAG: hypothetical protein WC551_06970 [Patescibacteria group bacterium]
MMAACTCRDPQKNKLTKRANAKIPLVAPRMLDIPEELIRSKDIERFDAKGICDYHRNPRVKSMLALPGSRTFFNQFSENYTVDNKSGLFNIVNNLWISCFYVILALTISQSS